MAQLGLAFDLDFMSEIYAPDDPAYCVGEGITEQQPWDALLTPQQRELALKFAGVVEAVRRRGIKVNAWRLIEACRDYFSEGRTEA